MHFQGSSSWEKTDEEAREVARTTLPGESALLDNVLATGFVGSPETLAERIEALAELDVDYVILQMTPAHETLQRVREMLLPLL